jgi:Mrp family chromosome partitioning ATPase/uncharacterized protein involved in exopolysaccharide biosynthesis
MVHQALRGRYVLAIILGMITGGLGTAAGWKLGKPTYHSESLIRVAYSLPQVFERTDQNEPMGQMFDTFMQSQRLLITSRRVTDMALQDPVWKASGRQVPADPEEYFRDSLAVEVRPRSEYIAISVKDLDPATAAAAVTSIANAYAELYHGQEKQFERQRTGVLDERQAFLQSRIEQLNTQLRAIATKHGTTSLGALHDAALVRVNRFATALADVRMAMVGAGPESASAPSSAGDAGGAPATQPSAILASGVLPEVEQREQNRTPEQLALTDPIMRGYLTDEETLDRELTRLESRGYGASHPQIVATRRALEDARERTRRYAALPPTSRLAPAPALQQLGAGGGPLSLVTAGKSIEDLRRDEAAIRGFHKEAKVDLAAIGLDQAVVRQLDAELAAFRLELDQVARRITALRAEAALGGRLNIISTGEIPLSPNRDPRLKMAGAVGLLGAGLPAALLVLLPLVRPRYRYHDEAEADIASRIPLLGILPTLKRFDPHSDETAGAAQSLHHMRVTLAAQAERDDCCTYLVTSATSGEGKTSLTMSLGLSFAACQTRTLVIDGDLVGRQLTRGLGAGELPGLIEALAAGSLRKLVRKTAGGVFVLPAGKAASPADACGMSAVAAGALLDEARRYFDVVLIDSGPIIGSVEAAVFAPQADAVILTVARGQHRRLVQRAQRRLDTLGARIAGVVFNRAKLNDFRRSSYGSSSNSSASTPGYTATLPAPEAQGRYRGFGPLVQAVASGTRSFPA